MFILHFDPASQMSLRKHPDQKLAFLALMAVVSFSIYSCNYGKKERNPSPNKLRIISYNVWYGFTEVPERKETWFLWVKTQDPDIVVLQELNGYSDQKLAEEAKRYGHEYSDLLKEEGFPTGITARYPIEDIQRIKEGFHHGLMRVRIQGIYFYVIHLHPSNWEFRIAEIHQILKDIEELPPDSKVLLVGDFNALSPLDSVYYAHGRLEPFFNQRDLLYEEKNLNKGHLDYSVIQEIMDFGFIDLEAHMRDSSYRFTGSFPSLIEKEGEHGDRRRLDFVFASKNLMPKVSQAKICATDTTLILSDHLPVIVDLDQVPVARGK